MAGLYDHIRGTDDTGADVYKMPVHQFMSAAAEVERGAITKPQAAAMFPELVGTALSEADAILDRVIAGTLGRQVLHDVMMLAEMQLVPYDGEAFAKTRLGF